MKAAGVIAACAVVTGCALLGPSSIDENGAGVMRSQAVAPQAALAIATAGTTRAQLSASLGRANVVHFDSGWEVWVYRWPGADRTTRGATEVVVLLDPQGIVKKSRLRPGARS